MIMESKPNARLTKNSSNSRRFLHCFRTPEMDKNGRVSGSFRRVPGHDHDQPVFTYVDMGEKQGVVFPEILSDDVDVHDGGGNNKDRNGVEKKKKSGNRGGRKLLLMMRAVMFETSLAKKIRKKKQKQKQKQCQSDGNLLIKPEKPWNGNYLQQESSDDENGRTMSRNCSSLRSSSSVTSSSGCSSSISSNPRHRSERINSFRSNNSFEGKQNQDRGRGYYRSNICLCFLLISLFVLVFWGRVCAIVCTSTWLFFVPRRLSTSGNVLSSKNVVDYAKFDSEKYKKKIIIEGLLERNHSRGL
ncbi:hypothetical protein ACOSP7_030646 [Xanthoceras sorbifolium]